MNADIVDTFVGTTGASKATATKYLAKSKGDVDAAVIQYWDDQEAGTLAAEDMPSAGAADAAGDSAVDAILGGIKGEKGSSKDSQDDILGKGGGKGKGDGERRTVAIVFFADGFMVEEDPEPPEGPQEPEQPAAPAPRRTGMMGLSDLKKEAKGRRGPTQKLPKLQPLRSYDTPENKKFLDLVKAGRLPEELQKRDAEGNPIAVTIAIEDARPRTYAELEKILKRAEQMQQDEEKESGAAAAKATPGPALFAGAGQTLSSSSGAAAGSSGAGNAGAAPSGAGADPALLALVDARPVPVADQSKPTTTLQMRLSSGARAKITLNLDHTVADLWRAVANEMGQAVF